MSPKALLCVTCNKGTGQFKCEGCSQTFCTKHVAEHRQALNQQLDEVILEHDIFQQTVTEDKNENHSLMVSIDQWEETSIDKIRQTAKEIREKVNQFENTHKNTIAQKLDDLKEEIKRAHEDDNFFENDIQNWSSVLEKLKQELKTAPLKHNTKEDLTSPLVYAIQVLPSSSDSTSNPVSKIHPRLQYTNQDGIYVNPKSFFGTSTWYFYSPKRNRWFWSQYQNFETCISVDTILIKSASYKDQLPAPINVEIIEYLRQNNPIPPEAIIQAASEAEDRILKL